MADIKVEKKEDASVVLIIGELTIEYAGALKDVLMQSLGSAERVILDFKDISGVDLSCFQLLCSAHREAVTSEKSIELKPGYAGTLKEAVRENGFSRSTGCAAESERSCLWKGM